MDDTQIIDQLDADAGWVAADLARAETREIADQRDSQVRWAKYQQPKLDAFNRIGVILSSDVSQELKLERITDAVQEANRKVVKIQHEQRIAEVQGD